MEDQPLSRDLLESMDAEAPSQLEPHLTSSADISALQNSGPTSMTAELSSQGLSASMEVEGGTRLLASFPSSAQSNEVQTPEPADMTTKSSFQDPSTSMAAKGPSRLVASHLPAAEIQEAQDVQSTLMDTDRLSTQYAFTSMNVEALLIPAKNFDILNKRIPADLLTRILEEFLLVEKLVFGGRDGEHRWLMCSEVHEPREDYVKPVIMGFFRPKMRILRTCREIYMKGRAVFWQNNRIEFCVNSAAMGCFESSFQAGANLDIMGRKDSITAFTFLCCGNMDNVKFVNLAEHDSFKGPPEGWDDPLGSLGDSLGFAKTGTSYPARCDTHDDFQEANLKLQFALLHILHMHHALEGRTFSNLELTFTGLEIAGYSKCSRIRRGAVQRIEETVNRIKGIMERLQRVGGGPRPNRSLVLKQFPRGQIGYSLYQVFKYALEIASFSSITDIFGCELVAKNGQMLPAAMFNPASTFEFKGLPRELQLKILEHLISTLRDKRVVYADQHCIDKDTCTPISDLLTTSKLFHHLTVSILDKMRVNEPMVFCRTVCGYRQPSSDPDVPTTPRFVREWLEKDVISVPGDLKISLSARFKNITQIHLGLSSRWSGGSSYDNITDAAWNMEVLQSLSDMNLSLKLLVIELKPELMAPYLRVLARLIIKKWLTSVEFRSGSKLVGKRSSDDVNWVSPPRHIEWCRDIVQWDPDALIWIANDPKSVTETAIDTAEGLQIKQLILRTDRDYFNGWSRGDSEWLFRQIFEYECRDLGSFSWSGTFSIPLRRRLRALLLYYNK